MKIYLTQNLAAILTGHGKKKAYLHRFKIMKEPTCRSGTAEQTTDHVIYECEKLTKEREREREAVDNRPTKRKLANK